MDAARLDLALDSGALILPDAGMILVLQPHAGDDLTALPVQRVRVVQGFRPDHDWFVAQGFDTVPDLGDARGAVAIVCLPRAKAEARGMIAAAVAAVAPGGLVVVDGQKSDGVVSVLRDLRARVPVSDPVSKAHGKLFSFHARGDGDDGWGFADWTARPGDVDGFRTVPGLFSADGPDRGSALLAAMLPEKLGGRVVDLGAGWGYLSRSVLERQGVRELHLVEAEAAAIDCARVNVTDPRALFHWADAMTFRLEGGVDAVVCNPPFHHGRVPDTSLGVAFLTAAARLLTPNGTLWLVANRHLPYVRPLHTLFAEVEEIGGDATFRLVRASRPVRAPR